MILSRHRPGVRLCLALAWFGMAAGMAAADEGKAYVSNQNDGISVIDLNTLEIVEDFDVGAKEPRGIGVTADGKLL